jgi:diguanylate cyclase (GGDEF)-like protein
MRRDGAWTIVMLVSILRSYFARTPDPYAGGDLDNAQRIGFALFGLQALLILALWPLSPPTHAIGEAGWIVAAGVVVGGILVTAGMRREYFASWTALLVASYGAVAALEVMQWLAGGVEAPYERAILLPVFFVAAIQPPRRIAAFLGFVSLGLVVPFIYDGWHAQAAGASAASLLILTGLSVAVNVLMSGIRAQRLAHAREEAEAREEARLDALTGLHNRRAFDEALGDEIKLARRLGIPLCVGMIDIVNFKQINDRWSPTEGDRCLQAVAEALAVSLRDPDQVFRWGGDEFALILTGTAAKNAGPLRDRLQLVVSSVCARPDHEPIEIRFAVAEVQDDETPEAVVEMAGLAMTAAKMDRTA